MREMTTLCLLARKYETDKGGRHENYNGNYTSICHEYTPVYWDLLHERRDEKLNVLEIGINAGCSLRMWEAFLPKAMIYAVDIDQNYVDNVNAWGDPHIRATRADQNSEISLLTALYRFVPSSYDLIVDDGSHEPAHQITSLVHLLPFLAPDGLYVIEDIHPGQHFAIAERVPHDFRPSLIRCEPGRGTGDEWLMVIERQPA
jgi:predicted O-methyltransferase YrrM